MGHRKRLTHLFLIAMIAVAGCRAAGSVQDDLILSESAEFSPLPQSVSKLSPIAHFKMGRPIYSLSWSPEGRYLAIGGTRKIILWDGVVQWELKTSGGAVYDVLSLRFSPDGKTLAAGNYTSIDLFDVAAGKHVTTFFGHNHYVQALAFSPDGRWLASVGLDRTIRIWDLKRIGQSPSLLHQSLFDPSTTPLTVSFSPDQTTLAVGTAEGRLILYSFAEGKQWVQYGHQGEIRSLIFSPDGSTLISAGRDRMIRRWDVQTGRPLETQELDGEMPFIEIAANGILAAAAALESEEVAVFRLY